MIPNRPAKKPKILEDLELLGSLSNENLGRNNLRFFQLEDSFRFGEEQVLFSHWISQQVAISKLAQSKSGKSPLRIADIGSGSGILTVLLSALIPGSSGLAIEKMERPYKLLEANLAQNYLSDRFTTLQADIRTILADGFPKTLLPHTYDLVVMNPPYFRTDAGPKSQENTSGDIERLAARVEHFASLGDFIALAEKLVGEKAQIAVLHRPERLMDLSLEAQKHKLQLTKLTAVKVREGEKPSVFFAILEKTKHKQFKWERDIVIRDAQNQYTPEVRKLYSEYDN